MTRRDWTATLGLDAGARRSRLGFLELSAADRKALTELAQVLEPRLEHLVDRWHRFLLKRPETRELMARSGVREHLRTVQTRYFRTLLAGPYDRRYFHERLRIGFVHERVGLEPPWYTGAYRKFLQLVAEVLRAEGISGSEAVRWIEALEKVVFLDLQLALDAYFHTRNQALVQANERLQALAERLEAQNRALTEAFGRAQEAARVKEAFLAQVSHELRTPLNAILGFADLLSDGIDGPVTPEQRRTLARIRSHGERLVEMIDQMLDAAKLAAVALGAPEAFDPEPVVAEVIRSGEDLAAGKGLGFEADLDRPIPPVQGEPEGLRLALGHLVENAVKFTREGRVGLRVRGHGDRVRFEVWDTGPGVPEEHRQRIFEPFHQVDSGDTREVTGLGMGLPLARRAVERMGGTLELAETGPDGSVFALELARATASSRVDFPNPRD
ncbi:protoglobin domain-containing protein [Deferrisoma camini]|uniref:protoglobin domain-containing protein n=1 Tax=Deferrisoma camini TaxID=1035120 RepID=UPI00046CD77C|nr:protoglobin domain-containing protein [Deferrisoma camini]